MEGDEHARHYGAYLDQTLVSVASIYIDGSQARLRKFAILSQYQGQGIGSELLDSILQQLKNDGITHFWCDARESALGFYARFGMQPEGTRFYKVDVPYFKLARAL